MPRQVSELKKIVVDFFRRRSLRENGEREKNQNFAATGRLGIRAHLAGEKKTFLKDLI